MGIEHVFIDPSNYVGAVLALDIVCENLSVSTNLTDETVSSALENKTNGEVWVIFLLFQTRFYQS
jgi:hypothetical protein